MPRGRPRGRRNRNQDSRRAVEVYFVVEEIRRRTGWSYRSARALAASRYFRSEGSLEYQFRKGERAVRIGQAAGIDAVNELYRRHVIDEYF